MRIFLVFLMLLTANVAFGDAETVLTITHPENTTQMQSVLSTKGKHEFGSSLINYIKGLQIGSRPASIVVDFNNGDDAVASGTVSIVSDPTAGDYITIGGSALTAVASGSTPSTDQFAVGATTTLSAYNIASAINLNANSFDGFVSATSSGSVVTISAVNTGSTGNGISLAESTSTVRISVSGSKLSGGKNDTSAVSTSTFGYGK